MEDGPNGRRRFVDSGHDTLRTILPHFLGARLGTCSIVSDVNHFKRVLFQHARSLLTSALFTNLFTVAALIGVVFLSI